MKLGSTHWMLFRLLFRKSYWPLSIWWKSCRVLSDNRGLYMYGQGLRMLWEDPSGSESDGLLVLRVESSTSGWGSLWKRSLVGSQFPKSVLRDITGTVQEGVRACGCKRNSFNLNRTPTIRDSALLNFWDSFLVILPSISSETCVMYSSVIRGTNVFCDWLFLVCFYVSVETAANFRFFLNVAISFGRNYSTVVKTGFYVFFIQPEEWQKLGFQMSDKLQSLHLTD